MFIQGDPRGRSKIGIFLMVLIFGIVLPLQSGRQWVETANSIIVWGWMPFLWVSGIVADCFAGERERHTLEALLATRLSDRAILFGKVLAAMLYGFILTWSILLLSLVTVNLSAGRGHLLFFRLDLTVGALVFSILICGLAATLGVLVSLRAGSVRQAQQLTSAGVFLLIVPFMLIQFLPDNILNAIADFLQRTEPLQIALWIAMLLLVIDGALLFAGMRLFQRRRLILD
jgi:ABC-2 type transport system permease protein